MAEIRLTSRGWLFLPVFIGIHASQVVVWDFRTINSIEPLKIPNKLWTLRTKKTMTEMTSTFEKKHVPQPTQKIA